MIIRKTYYCIVDGNGKRDERFLFEDFESAQKKLIQIKNSISGETLFVSEKKRDFFPDGVKRDYIGQDKKIKLQRGCWTSLRIKKVSLLDSIEPERFFRNLERSKSHELYFSKVRERENWMPLETAIENAQNMFSQEKKTADREEFSPIADFNLKVQNSFLKSRAFLASFGVLCVATLASVFAINHSANNKIAEDLLKIQMQNAQKIIEKVQVLGAKAGNSAENEELDRFVLETLRDFEKNKSDELEKELAKILAGSPMEKMAPMIAKQDRTVAAFIVGIAKKESNFGRRVPVLDGKDCYNYWGYRGIRDRMGTGGHTCFDSPEDAVATVAKRVQNLVKADVDTPKEMVLWKCGSSCAGHSDESVKKWISDVNIYFSEINEGGEQKKDDKG